MLRSFLFLFIALVAFESCTTTQNGSGLSTESAVQRMLNDGVVEALGILGDKDQFLTNALIDAALPQELRDINDKLESIGLGSIVEQEKEYVAQIAQASIATSKPILEKAISGITQEDALGIITGGGSSGTSFLRDKTELNLTNALTPMVTSEMDKLGLTNLIDNAIGGSGSGVGAIIGTLLGNDSSSSVSEHLGSWISSQLIDGMFNVVADSEREARSDVIGTMGKLLGS